MRRLRWRCRRGLLELDLLLLEVLKTQEGLLRPYAATFEALLEAADADIMAWIRGLSEPPADLVPVIAVLRDVDASGR